MSTTTCQVVAFLLSILGLAGCIAATGMDMWSTQDLYDNPVTSVFQYEGLWRSCVRQSSGFTECRPYFTILGLPEDEREEAGRNDFLKSHLEDSKCECQDKQQCTEGSWKPSVTRPSVAKLCCGREEQRAKNEQNGEGAKIQQTHVPGSIMSLA
ncbi:hypothetical protein P7K49_031640 [Saguinus oedipus]|uniref:Claudin n=1 Tax=Saguinus oedipus TaxID=9490 RepID=A0ABQ9U0S4_SAGOE|nr:hypothetical protein P7K49_031640 [Saguinus oedipus]